MSSAHEDIGGGRAPHDHADQHDEDQRDEALVLALRACRCQGPVWVEARERLARYGVGTLRRLLRDSQRLTLATAALGRAVRLSAEEIDLLATQPATTDRLVGDAVVMGVQLFREHAVLAEAWQPHGGARLATYFVNGCLLSLPNLVRSWRRSRTREEVLLPREPDAFDRSPLSGRGGGDPLTALVAHEDVARTVEWLGPVLARAALLRLGSTMTWAEIAGELGLPPKRLERMLHAFRASHDHRGPEPER